MQAVADLFLPKRKFKPQQASSAQIFEPFPKFLNLFPSKLKKCTTKDTATA